MGFKKESHLSASLIDNLESLLLFVVILVLIFWNLHFLEGFGQ